MNEKFEQLFNIVKKLRHPKEGCPWDLLQTNKSLATYAIEEAYEVANALNNNDYNNLCEELGDLLFQVFLQAQIASENKNFTIEDVITKLNEKLIRRHPHVFSKPQSLSIKEIEYSWNEIKSKEENRKPLFEGLNDLKNTYPATLQAKKLGDLSKKYNFDWKNKKEVFIKLKSEITELEDALEKGSSQEIENEIGDVYFTLAQLCRHLKRDPEVIACIGNQKFIQRFNKVMKKFNERKESSLEDLWQMAKESEKVPSQQH